jgi:hypothetical protein
MAEGPQAPIGHRCQIEDSEVQYDDRTPLCSGVSPILYRGGSHLARSRTSVRGALSKGRGVRVPGRRRGVRRGGSGAPASAAPTGAPGRNGEGSDARDADSIRRGGANGKSGLLRRQSLQRLGRAPRSRFFCGGCERGRQERSCLQFGPPWPEWSTHFLRLH